MLELKRQLDAAVRRHPPTALEVSSALDRAIEHVPELAVVARRGRATALHFNGRDEEAIGEFRRCVDLYEAGGEEVEAARVRRSLVEVLQQAGRGAEALDCAKAAREVLERNDEPKLLAQLEVNVGNVFLHRDEYDRAREHYTHAHELFTAQGDTLGQAFSGYNLAVVEMNANRLEAAEAAWRGSRAAWDSAGMAVHVADCDYSLAYLESRRGRFESAIQGLELARGAYETTAKPAGVPLCDLDLAEIYLKLDALFDAAEHARRAAARFEELQLSYEQARAEAFLGLALARMGRLREASSTFDRAGQRLTSLGNDVYADALVVQRAFLVPAQENDPAVLTRSRDRLLARGMVVPAAMAWIALARALLAQGEAEAARTEMVALLEGRPASSQPLFQAGAPEMGALEEVLEAEARRTLAAARVHLGDRLGAIEDLRTATRAIDRAYGTVSGADLRLTFLRDRHDAFADLSWLLAEGEAPGAAREAFIVLERSRSRSLEEPTPLESPDDEYRRARERLDWLLSRRLDFEFGQATGEHDLRALEAPAQEVREVQDQVASLARGRRSRSAAPRTGGAAMFADADLRAACGKDDVLLAYLTSEAGARVWVVDGGEVESQPISISLRRLSNLRDRLWLHLDRCRWDAGDRGRLEQSIDPILAELGARLVEPVLSKIDGRRIVVLPFGMLHDVPFHALRVGAEPLIERCDIGYAFSAGMLGRRRSAPAPVGGRVLATGAGRASLVQVGEELGHLRRLFGARVDEVGPESIVHRLTDAPPRGGLLHIAGHGLHQPDNAAFSALSLGDRVLLAHDISRSRLDLALAVLSGCETGRKSRLGGDELFGLSRAFFSAGTRSVVGSLWSVEDRDAAHFMGQFYEHLAAGETVRTAVSRAQRALREQRGHPYSWGAFVVTGDPDLRFPA